MKPESHIGVFETVYPIQVQENISNWYIKNTIFKKPGFLSGTSGMVKSGSLDFYETGLSINRELIDRLKLL